MNDDEERNAKRAAILRKAIERLEEALLYVEGEQREGLLNLTSKARLALTRLDKRQLH